MFILNVFSEGAVGGACAQPNQQASQTTEISEKIEGSQVADDDEIVQVKCRESLICIFGFYQP